MVSADGRCATPAATLAQAANRLQPAAGARRPPGRLCRGRSRRRTYAGRRNGVRRSRFAAIGAGYVRPGSVRRHRSWHDRVSGRSRAGSPNNVAIGAGEKGERKVVLTYLSGPWPGIYTFNDGRLKIIDRAPEQPKPAKAAPKKKPVKPKTASHEIDRAVVRSLVTPSPAPYWRQAILLQPWQAQQRHRHESSTARPPALVRARTDLRRRAWLSSLKLTG